MKKQYIVNVLLIFTMFILHGCNNEKEYAVSITQKNLSFKAENISVDSKQKIIANSDTSVKVNWTIHYKVNDEEITVNGSSVGNELPVMAGHEIEITFLPSCKEEEEALFTLPDGKVQKVTATSPSFKWTVPDNFTEGMKITAESHYQTADAKFTTTGFITLINIK